MSQVPRLVEGLTGARIESFISMIITIAMISYSEQIQNEISRSKGLCAEVCKKLSTSFQDSSPMETYRVCLILSAFQILMLVVLSTREAH